MRLRAFLLLTLFLSAGTSLPGLDAVLYHWHVDRRTDETHFDPPGGCGGHADHCTLARTPPGSTSIQTLTVEVRLPTRYSHAPVRSLTTRALVSPRGTLPLTRAPPAASV